MFLLKNNFKGVMVVRVALIIWVVLFAGPVHALGVGAATAQSYIGQSLLVTIPLFNVDNPEALTVELTSLMSDIGGTPELSANIDRANSQLAIVVKSDRPINEPYLGFSLQLVDGQQILNKEFTVLLNLSPQRLAVTSAESNSAQPYEQASPTVQGIANNQSATSGSGDLLGPYDWAVAGNIPNRFGAVIDGQSLWRVARRINKAMGVSIDQMMWALYQQNREAFSTRSVDSLRAGSYLTIPSYEVVSQLSDAQAKAALQRLSSNPEGDTESSNSTAAPIAQTSPVLDNVPVTDAVDEVPSADDDDQSAGIGENTDAAADAEIDSFQLTGISDANSLLNGVDASDAKAQEIISSLAVTVGNLTQELIRKDKQIEFLEEKIAALERVASLDKASLGSAQAAARFDMATEDSSALDVDSVLAVEPSNDEAEVKPKTASNTGRDWLLWLLPLLVILLAGIVFRNKLISLAQQLNLFGTDEKIDFGRNEVKLSPAPMARVKPKKDYSVMSSVQKRNDDDHDGVDVVEDVSYLSFNDHDEEDSSLEAATVDADDQNLGFEQRFVRLLDEKDFDFARELLDFARHNEINDERYHCERLRLYHEMHDEDGFYEYYYEIESKIPTFDPEMQNRISKLVVELSQYS